MEEFAFRKVRARRIFKAAVRQVIANLFWMGVIDDEEGEVTVQKTIQLAWKRQKKGLLSLHEKYLLRKPAENRTEEEKLLLGRVLVGIKCLRKYPENVQMQLAANAYFEYFGSGRTIIRQGHDAFAMYFIITGDVEVVTEGYDKFLEENFVVSKYSLRSGDVFGDVSLFHNIPRNSTITTLSPCELLVLKREDFDGILKGTLQIFWDEILQALDLFTYFEEWDIVKRRDCCIIAKIRSYLKNDIILNGDARNNYVHFILEGKCVVIETLYVLSSLNINGEKVFTLPVQKPKEPAHSSLLSQNINKLDRNAKRLSAILEQNNSASDKIRSITAKPGNNKSQTKGNTIKGSFRDSLKRIGSENDDEVSIDAETIRLPENAQTVFMQTHYFTEKACFNIGETMPRRLVTALTNVKILLIPFWWLSTNLKAHQMFSIKRFLEKHTPTTNDVFKEFIRQRKWRTYKKDLVKHLTHLDACNTINNIPYSVRILEDFDYEPPV